MKVIRPMPITEAALLASSVAEADYPPYSAAATYALEARVISGHAIWESAQANNTGHPLSDVDWWYQVGPTNRWRMFDQAVGSLTTDTSEIAVTVAAGAIDTLAVLDTDADLVRVAASRDGTTVYDVSKSTEISGGVIADWYDYFTAEIGRVTALVFSDLPLNDLQITVTFEAVDPAGTVSVGTMLIGRAMGLGSTEAGSTVGSNDYSRKETDEFGVTTVVQRAWSKTASLRTLIETAAADGIQRALAAMRAVPALWIGEDGYDSLTIYGFYKSFSIDLTIGMDPVTRTGGISYVSYEIEGLI